MHRRKVFLWELASPGNKTREGRAGKGTDEIRSREKTGKETWGGHQKRGKKKSANETGGGKGIQQRSS